MKVLGIDSGSRVLGYGLIDAQGDLLSYIECGVLTASATLGKYQRLAEIGRDLEALLVELKPDAVAMEQGFIGPVRGGIQQGMLVSAAARGVAGFICARAGLPVVEYAPATVKKFATGKGNADKALVAKMVKMQLMLKAEPAPDAADALGVAIAHARMMVAERRAAARAA
jgi:crossover junction endodeoxyribonuclease RuvC